MEIRNMLAARGRSRKDGFPTVGAVCDRPHFVNSRKNARSQTAPTIDTASALFRPWTKGTVFAKMKDIITVNGCEAQDETYRLYGERSDVFRSKFVLAPAS